RVSVRVKARAPAAEVRASPPSATELRTRVGSGAAAETSRAGVAVVAGPGRSRGAATGPRRGPTATQAPPARIRCGGRAVAAGVPGPAVVAAEAPVVEVEVAVAAAAGGELRGRRMGTWLRSIRSRGISVTSARGPHARRAVALLLACLLAASPSLAATAA